jgi:hypothetical protein
MEYPLQLPPQPEHAEKCRAVAGGSAVVNRTGNCVPLFSKMRTLILENAYPYSLKPRTPDPFVRALAIVRWAKRERTTLNQTLNWDQTRFGAERLRCAVAVRDARARARTHSRTHALTHARTHARTHSRTHARTHSRTHALMHARTRARTHSRTHARTHALTHARTHAHRGAHRRSRTHAHVYACALTFGCAVLCAMASKLDESVAQIVSILTTHGLWCRTNKHTSTQANTNAHGYIYIQPPRPPPHASLPSPTPATHAALRAEALRLRRENTLLWAYSDNGGMTHWADVFPASASSNWWAPPARRAKNLVAAASAPRRRRRAAPFGRKLTRSRLGRPLRGGKTTLFEGGVRAVSFVAGGRPRAAKDIHRTVYVYMDI